MPDIGMTTSLLRDMSQKSEPQDLLGLFLAHAHQAFQVERAIVISREGLDHPDFRILLSAGCGKPSATTMVADPGILRTGGLLAELLYAGQFRTVTPLVLDDAEPARDLLAGGRSLVAFPLYGHGESVGMVVLLSPSERTCREVELCGLALLAALLQRADRAHAIGKQFETNCQALDAELAAVGTVQRWLLPPAALPAAGVDVGSFYRTAHHAGGDYYDVGTLPDGGFGVMVADVSGRGAAAAVWMAVLRTIVRCEVDRLRRRSPAALLDHADEHLCTIDMSSRGAFITALSGRLDATTGRFAYSCAGHPPPRRLRAADGTVVSIDGARSLPLGILGDHPPRTEEFVMLGAGDLLLFYSDGITEVRARDGEIFGTERLDRVLREVPRPACPAAVIQAVIRAVEEFADGEAPADDQTLLAVQWLGEGGAQTAGASSGRNADIAGGAVA